MSKHYSKKRRLKYVFVALACAASFSLTGLAAACKPGEDTDNTQKTTSKEDTQLLKNGNFEFFKVPEQKDGEKAPEYLINTPDNWNHQGSSSYTMSGIIGTSDKAWENLTKDDLAERLDANNALDSSSSSYKEEHIDFNGMKSSDLLYKDSYGALKYGTITSEQDGDDTKYYIGDGDSRIEIYKADGKEEYFYDSDMTKPVSKEFISNPEAHNIFKEKGKDPYFVDADGKQQKIYEDGNGDYYLEKDEDKDEYRQPVGHVLMLHNYSNSNHNGIEQSYASIELTLPANTSAEVSVWVKTSNLLYGGGKEANADQDHGANITVTHTAGSTTLDDFAITSINTEKLIQSGAASDKYNGWVEYTVYINACNFASSNVTLKLGLGETGHPVEGYAFFDDVSVTKYVDLDDCPSYTDEVKAEINRKDNAPKCDLTSDASEKIFVADTFKRPTENGSFTLDRYSKDFHYLLDITAEDEYAKYDLIAAQAKAGLTVDENNYVSSKGYRGRKDELRDPEAVKNEKLPDDLKNLKTNNGEKIGIDTSEDYLALVEAGHKFDFNKTYDEKLIKALNSAKDLPFAGNDSQMLVLFSAKGAAYTASFDIDIAAEDYKIVSFWIKTSDMAGSTAATVKITEEGNKENTANITLDSTGIVTDIDDDKKDIYDGWVQCFFFLHNDNKADSDAQNGNSAKIHVEFSFGNTSLNGTLVTSYKAGWAALANMQTLSVKEEVFAYTGSGSYTASLTVKDADKKTPSVFDEISEGQAHKIESAIVDPASYTGTNGGSSKVVNNGVISPFDKINPSDTAGLINKEYFVKGGYASEKWYEPLLTSFGYTHETDPVKAAANWEDIFGTKSVQPLIIVNSLRQDYVQQKGADSTTYKNYYYYDEDKEEYVKVTDEDFDEDTKYYTREEVINYGFIGEEKTVSSNGFTTVTVRVKVSKNAIAYIYLVDTENSAEVLGFNAPSYTFWYDSDGNVLKDKLDEKASLTEQRENVLYTLREDGLYEDKDGKLRANVWNYTKLYTANITYYTKDGKYSIDELEDGVTYYTDEACTKLADCFIVTSDGTKLYEFKDGKYYYIVSGETQKDEVLPFEKEYARYTYEGLSEEYMAVVDGNETNEWVTINFVIHAGSESKKYRLELWSGERGEYKTDKNGVGGSVIFDYSYTSITDDKLLNEYQNDIIKAYRTILADNGQLDGTAALTWNIEDYEKQIEKCKENGDIKASDVEKYEALKKTYTAHYYSYSLYDSASFKPFNKNVADENATGYDYSVNDYNESLAYFEINGENERTVFIDYSTIDQSISLDLGSEDEDEDKNEEEEDKDTANVWLLASSIILVVALIFAMIAILVKDAMKKSRRKKVLGKNSYDSSRANRYIRRLGIKKEEIEEVDAPAADTAEPEQTETTDVEPEQTETTDNGETPDEGSENNE